MKPHTLQLLLPGLMFLLCACVTDQMQDLDSSQQLNETDDSSNNETDYPDTDTFDTNCVTDTNRLIPGKDGWVDACDNQHRFQGYWYAYSTIAEESRYEIEMVTNEDGSVCASGWVSPPHDDTGLSDVGAGIGLWLCQTRGDDGSVLDTYTMDECPWDVTPYQILGFAASFTGNSDSDFQILFGKPDAVDFANFPFSLDEREDSFYYTDATVPSDPDINWFEWGFGEVNTIRFQVTDKNVKEDGKFDFCVSHLEPVPGHIDFL